MNINMVGGVIMLNKAIALAVNYHIGQFDKSGELYILHPLRVMLNPCLKTEKERIVAVLHDIIEDTDCHLDELKQFGEDVVVALTAISRVKNESYTDYLDRVKKNTLALSIKLADIEDNLNPIRLNRLSPIVRDRLKNKYHEALTYLRGGCCE